MDNTTGLKKFAQGARRQLLEQVSSRMEQVLRSDSVEIREKAKVVEQVKIDLDERVKVNYSKFGGALSPIKGL